VPVYELAMKRLEELAKAFRKLLGSVASRRRLVDCWFGRDWLDHLGWLTPSDTTLAVEAGLA
jgi:hypothetical protein